VANDKKGLIVLGGLGLGAYLLMQHANATGNNPSNPPTGNVTPSSGMTPLEQTRGQVTWIYNMLAQHGFASQPMWYSATSIPTELPVDTTGAGRNLVTANQAVTDLYQQYFWNVNTLFGWTYPAGAGNSSAFGGNFPGLSGSNSQTATTDPAAWSAMQDQYNQLTAALNPTFLA